MRKLLAATWLLLTSHAANAQQTDIFALYDGGTGVTCKAYNQGGYFFWWTPGGDWTDKNGVRQGVDPFASVDVPFGATGQIEIDATGIGRRIMLRFSGAPASFHSRETATPPVLRVTEPDGTTIDLTPTADSSLSALRADGSCNSTTAMGQEPLLQHVGAVLEFPDYPDGANAKLLLTVRRTFGAKTTVSAYRTLIPTHPPGPVTGGFSAQYPDDNGIGQDARVFYHEDWGRRADGSPPADWWQKTKGTYVLHAPSNWPRQSNGVPMPSWWTGQEWLPDCGDGRPCLNVHYYANQYNGYAVPSFDFVKAGYGEQDHVYFRYYLRYADTFRDPYPCDGGKRPGWSAPNQYGGNGGLPSSGYNGWSLRGHYLTFCDSANPIYPRIPLGVYVYHGEQKDFYGDDYAFTAVGDLGFMRLNEWVCFEGEVRMNTPGQKNGVVRHWINGVEVQAKTDLYLRGIKPEQGYGDWQIAKNAATKQLWDTAGYPTIIDPITGHTVYFLGRSVPGELGISMFQGAAFQGGKYPFGRDTDQYYRDFVVAKEKVGCRVSGEEFRAKLERQLAELATKIETASTAIDGLLTEQFHVTSNLNIATTLLVSAETRLQQTVGHIDGWRAGILDLQEKIAQANAAIDDLMLSRAMVEQEIVDAKSSVEDLQAKRSDLDGRIAAQRDVVRAMQEELARIQLELDKLPR